MIQEHDRDLSEGWWNGKPVRFLAGGPTALAPAGIYIAVRSWSSEGRPQLVEGQRPILDALPGRPGYSALRFVHYFELHSGLQPDAVRSVSDVLNRARRIHTPGHVVHTPVVPPSTRTLWPTVPAWHDSNEVAVLDGGLAPLAVNRIYLGIRGVDRKQNRLIYIPGQRWVFEWAPGHPAYGPIARVHYVELADPDSGGGPRSVADLLKKSRALHLTRTFVTAAILEIDGKLASPTPPPGLP